MPGHFFLSLVGTDLIPSAQVKVDKSCALEHVTRDRVRGGQRRRPPTRVHLKEVRICPKMSVKLGIPAPQGGSQTWGHLFPRTRSWAFLRGIQGVCVLYVSGV